MITKGKRKSTTLYLAAALFLASYFAQTTECFRLRKTERREGRKEADAVQTTDFQPGRVVFGNVFEKKSGPETQSVDGTRTSNASSEDDANYQADAPGFSLFPSGPEAQSMGSVDCGQAKMKFKTQGDVKQFAMDPGATLPVPLSQVSPVCGYNVQRNAQSLLMLAPYSGCYMIQEGGYYVLPMRFRGIPFSLWCPIPPLQPPTTAAPTTTKKPDMPDSPQFPPIYFPFPPWGFPHSPQNPPGQNQQIPQFPKFPIQYPVPVTAIPATTSAQTTSTTTQSASPQQFNVPFSPFGLPFPWNFWMSHPAAKLPPQPPVFNSQYYPFPPVFNYPYPHQPPKMDPTQGRPPVPQAPSFPNPFPPYGQSPVKPIMYHG